MMLIKEHKLFFYAILLSLILHAVSISMLKKESYIKYENIISFELIPLSKSIEKAIVQEENNIDDSQKIVENIDNTPIINKNKEKQPAIKKALPVNKQQKNKEKDNKKDKEINKENKQTDSNIKDNNILESYAKAHLSNIQSQIVSKITYPQQAKKLGIEGSGYLIILIDSKGYITSIKAKDFPHKLLENAALKAAKKVGQVAGHNLASIELKIPVNFYIR